MMEIQTTLLSDVLESAVSGFASGANDPSGVAQVRMNNVETDGSWNWSSIRRVPQEAAKDRYYLQAGDVLFNATNSPNLVGKSAYFGGFDEPVVFSNHFVRLRASPTTLDGRYLARWLNLLWKQRLFETRCTQWVNQATYRKDDLLALQIPLPPLTEQKRIAGILDAADALRAKRRAALAELDALLQSTFLDMFGDPERWPAVSVASLAESGRGTFSNGPFGSNLLTSELTDSGVPVIYIRDIRNGEYDRVSQVCVTPEKANELNTCQVLPGDILIAKVGDPPGVSAVYPKGEPLGVITQDVIRLRPNPDLVDSKFFSAYINSPFGKRMIREITVEATRSRFGLTDFKLQNVPLPPFDFQRRFAAVCEATERQKIRMRSHLAEMDTLFASLQSKAFNGEL